MMHLDQSNFDAKLLMAHGKRATATQLRLDHSKPDSNSYEQHLDQLCDIILNPIKPIDDWETIDWCKWLMAGGYTPNEFATIVRSYNDATTCGLVWTPNFVAYRCRTCGISPCMSLCTECFKKGNHYRHDFNMFLSQAGGACDCGDISVMKPTGFCYQHGPDKATNRDKPIPNDLMCIAEAIMPRVIFRLILHFRENGADYLREGHKCPVQDADEYINMLLDFDGMGSLMRRIMTTALTDPQKYKRLNEIPETHDSDYLQLLLESQKLYEEALHSFPNLLILNETKSYRALDQKLIHSTLLEELVFWIVKFEFPQRFVCLLLHMLPDSNYKEAFTRAFVLHYSRISIMLERSNDPDILSNRVVHISVQLFSNKELAWQMTEELNLLHVMVVSLMSMMQKILIPSILHNTAGNSHYVVDCGQSVMREHCYWPLVSDLNNVLSHRAVALKYMSDTVLMEMWFEFLAVFQGMNVNQREMSQHIEFEPNTYYAAFSAELEASSYPMWALVSHLTNDTTAPLTRRLLFICLAEINDWLRNIYFTTPFVNDHLQVSFHLPLHRYFSVFLCQAIATQGITLDEILPTAETLLLMMMHPLRIQVAFYEILNGLWVRNGLQIKGQAMTYIQCNFCNSMVDADFYLMQICCTRICYNLFFSIVIEKFHVKEWLSLLNSNVVQPRNPYLEHDHNMSMIESLLTFLTTLISVRTNIGMSESDVNHLEMITLLCMGDKTHSQLIDLMPERCGASQNRNYETLLADVADYHPPTAEVSGTLQQGRYTPKNFIWEHYYDPVYVLLRAVHRNDFQTSMDRYTEFVRQANLLKTTINPWPPLRTPKKCNPNYLDPRTILESRYFHSVCFIILYKALNGGAVSEHILALLIFVLDQMVSICQHESKTIQMDLRRDVYDRDLLNWYTSDCVVENFFTIIEWIRFKPNETHQDSSDVMDVDQGSVGDISTLPLLWPEPLTPSTSNQNNTTGTTTTTTDQIMELHINESIATLLLKLHSQISGVPDSFRINTDLRADSLIGDGAFFIGKVLNQIAAINELACTALKETQRMLWPAPSDSEDSTTAREAKRRLAKERQQRFLAEFRDRQKRFIEKNDDLQDLLNDDSNNTTTSSMSNISPAADVRRQQQNVEDDSTIIEATISDPQNQSSTSSDHVGRRQHYDCVICNQSSVSSDDKPMGLVVLVQATSVIGHRRRVSGKVLPCSDDEVAAQNRDDTLTVDYERKFEEFERSFDYNKYFLSMNTGWDGGVHVQTCGHHLHLECLHAYQQSLRTEQRQGNIFPERGEYLCPLCRQLANAVLPLLPDLGGESQTNPDSNNLYKIHDLLMRRNDSKPIGKTKMTEAIQKLMDTIAHCSRPKPNFKALKDRTTHPQNLFVFLTSVARTNLEVELEQRGGSLIFNSIKPCFQCLLPKRDCIVPLLHILSSQSRFNPEQIAHIFQQLCGWCTNDLNDREIPILLRDPIGLLLQFILLLPTHPDSVHFGIIVQMLYDLLMQQIISQLYCQSKKRQQFDSTQLSHVVTKQQMFEFVEKFINIHLPDDYEDDDDDDNNGDSETVPSTDLNLKQRAEEEVIQNSLPYLRIAALLKHHLYQDDLPEITDVKMEHTNLIDYLQIGSNNGMMGNGFEAWSRQFGQFAQKHCLLAKNLLSTQFVQWYPSRLLHLPREYERIFTYYHDRPCQQCLSIPQETSICLICGAIVCLKQACCKQQSTCEATLHANECGAGTGIFLVVTSTYVIVIRGLRACLWGSLYLDEFEEEDRDLKRGKPLFLSHDRYELLQQQWLAHRFDHTKKTWVQHRNGL